MPFWRTYYHLVWATKKREPLIESRWEPRLHAYLLNKAREIEIRVYAIDGWTDHVHLVVAIPPRLAVADAVRRLKGASAHYLNHELDLPYHFQWQRGYGVLTVGEKQKPVAIAYVHQQKERHAGRNTNGWLERVDEFDEGPPDKGFPARALPEAPPPPDRLVAEAPAEYIVAPVAEDFPF